MQVGGRKESVMDFKLEINMDNAAFTEYPEEELSRILADAGNKITDGHTSAHIYDINGNNVGNWEILTD